MSGVKHFPAIGSDFKRAAAEIDFAFWVTLTVEGEKPREDKWRLE